VNFITERIVNHTGQIARHALVEDVLQMLVSRTESNSTLSTMRESGVRTSIQIELKVKKRESF
jgi:hypothetical protein